MNKNYVILALLLTAATVLYNIQSTVDNQSTQYMAYLRKFNKPIPSQSELIYRSRLFADFVAMMEKHNADSTQTYKMGINQFSDLTKEEFMGLYLGELAQPADATPVKVEPVNVGFASETDWRNKNIITAIKNQGQCGSCWAFAATAAHESYQVQFKSQPLGISLSEQQLVDCSGISPYENNGCNGGYGVRALEYIKDFGQTTTDKYPYTARDGSCLTQTGSYRIFGVAEGAGCEEIEDLITRRPLAVRVDASNWHLYSSGIFSNCATNINHAVFMVGSSDTAWTIKNSWGPNWGEKGYIRLAKGNTCNVCHTPSFPL
jgi:C1A family cysteine protease